MRDMLTMTMWDLSQRDTWPRLETQATHDAYQAIGAYWIPERDAEGRLIGGTWREELPDNLHTWAERLTEDFIQTSIAIPQTYFRELRQAHTSGNPETIRDAQQHLQRAIIQEQTARNCYYWRCYRALYEAYCQNTWLSGRLPRRTTPLLMARELPPQEPPAPPRRGERGA